MKYIHFLVSALLLMGAAACDEKTQGDDGGQQTLTGPVSFTSEVVDMGQASATASWSDGDRVGVYMVEHGTNRIVGNASNAEYKAAASGALAAAGEQIHFSSAYNAFDFFAYYPYRANTSNYIVPIDLSNQSDPMATCLLYSNNAAGVAEQAGAVKLSFTHKLTKIAFTIAPGAGLTTADLASLAMTVEGLNSQADFNAMLGRISNRHTPLTAAATVAADGKSAQFVTIPAADQHIKLHFTLKNKLTFDWETDKTFSFTEGKIHTLNVTIGNSSVEVTPGAITDWTGIETPPTTGDGTELDPPKAYAVGDYYPDDTAPVGVVYQISDGGLHGKVVGFQEVNGKRWGTYPKVEATDGVPEAANANDGAKATKNLITVRSKAGNFNSDYALFAWIYTTMNNSDVDGVWYLPSKNEMRALLASISGLDFASIDAAWTDGKAMPNYSTTTDARKAFNAKLSAKGGIGLGSVGATYYTSTEVDGSYAWCLSFGTGMTVNNKFKHETAPRIHPVMAF